MKKPVDPTFELVGDQIMYKGMNVTRELVSGDLHKAMNSTGKQGGVSDGARDSSQMITPPVNFEKSLTYSGHPIRKKYKFQALPISIENPAGSFREGTDSDGHPWRSLIYFDYGYIRGTIGNDKDHVDCFIGHDRNATMAYIIHQRDVKTGAFDEDKIMLGWHSKAEAIRDYKLNYDRTDQVMGCTAMTMKELKKKLKETKLKPGMIKAIVRAHIRTNKKTGKRFQVREHTDGRTKKQDDPRQPRRAAQPDQKKMRVRAQVDPTKGRKQAKPDEKNPKAAPAGEIKVTRLSEGAGHTKGVFEDAAGNVYKHSMTLGQKVMTGGKFSREDPAKTDEHKILSSLQDLRGVPRVGEMVETSEGSAFQIERLRDIEPGTMSYDDYKAIESVLEQVNRRGIRYGDIGAPMRRDNGELVLADFSAAHSPTDGKPLGSYDKDLVQNVISSDMLSPEAKKGMDIAREDRIAELLGKMGKKGRTVADLKAAQKEAREKKAAVKPVNQTETKEFKKWFKKSKVVNEDGSPKEVFHESPDKFTAFDESHLGEGNDQYGSGHYFTNVEKQAKGYGENVTSAFLSIQNPMDYLSKEKVTKAQIQKLIELSPDQDALWNFGDISYEGRDKVLANAVSLYGERTYTIQNLNEISNDFYQDLSADFLKNVKEVLGYDGVVVDFEDMENTFYVAFDGGQIKHSKDNAGTFDPEDADFMKSMN